MTERLAWTVFIVLMFLGSIAGWLLGSPEFEDHDSITYLIAADIFGSLDGQAVLELSPDTTPLFPIAVAVLEVIFGNIELSARIISMLAFIMAAIALYKLGRQFNVVTGALLGIALLFYRPVE